MSRTKKLLAGTAAFLILAAGIAFLRSRDDSGVSTIEPNSIGVLDPESGEVAETIGLEARPGSLATSPDAVWVTNPDVGTVTRIDPIELEVRDSIQVGENPTGIAVGFDAVWVVDSGGPSVSRISPATDEVFDPIPVGNGPAAIAVGEGSVWVTNRFDGTVSRIDPERGEVIETIAVGLDPSGIVVGFGDVWVALSGAGTVVRIDPATNTIKQPISVGNAPASLAVSDDAVWVVNSLDDTVSRIDPETNTVADTTPVGNGPSGIAIVQGTVWVANEADGTLSRIEPQQTSADRIVIGSVPQGLASTDDDLWVSVQGTTTSHRGGTLRVLSQTKPSTFDPGKAYDPYVWYMMHLLSDGLVALRPIGGTNATLVPDLATSIPAPTDDGRTYRFQLRPDIRYSTGEVVGPADFRFAMERGFSLRPRTYTSFYGGLIGGEACGEEPRTCDLSEGIVTDDASGTITFHLVAPDPEFLYKLTLNFAYPVPSSVPKEHQKLQGVPGTGPYMMEAPMTDEGEVVLVRNPEFQVWSQAAQPDGYVDRIEWTSGVEPQAQVDAVAAGDADLVLDAALSGSLDEILVKFAAQVHTSPAPVTFFIVLDTKTPPFDNVQVRKAMNLAIDRDRVMEVFGGEKAALPTCQQLPPNFPGYERYCPYTLEPGPEGTWSARDLEEAKRLVRGSGTAGMRVVFEYPPFWGQQGRALGDHVVRVLDELGYRGDARSVPDTEFFDPGNEFQMAFDAWGEDYPAASNFIANRFTCDSSSIPSGGFCDPSIDAMIDRATRLQARDQAKAGALWAEIDHAIVDQAPYIWLINPIGVDMVSQRVGNYQYSLQWQALLNQLWVR